MVKSANGNKNQHFLADITILVLIPIMAAVVTLLLPLNLLTSTLLFFGLPALYISWQRRDIILRSSIFASVVAIISILTDYLAIQDQAWASTSSFHIRLAGSVPIEALVWVFLFTYLIVVYYLFFYDHASHNVVGKRMPAAFLVALAVMIWLCWATLTGIHSRVEYFYIKFGLLLIVAPLLIFTISFPRYIRIFVKIMPYFIGVSLLNITVSLQKGYWSYPGHHFVGWVQFGAYRFPVEELVFWIILYAPFLISQFEFFNNDRLKLKA